VDWLYVGPVSALLAVVIFGVRKWEENGPPEWEMSLQYVTDTRRSLSPIAFTSWGNHHWNLLHRTVNMESTIYLSLSHFIYFFFIFYFFLFFIFFCNSHSGEWSPNWVYSAHRPFTGLLYLPRVIVRMQNLVEWGLVRAAEVLGENLPQRHFVYHKSDLTRPGREPGPLRWEASY
jgi:hypothetical protein